MTWPQECSQFLPQCRSPSPALGFADDMWTKVKQSVVHEEPAPSAWDVVDVDARDEKGRTALINACEKGDAPVVRLLLIQRASPDVCTSDGQSPLYLACKSGSLECARMLLM